MSKKVRRTSKPTPNRPSVSEKFAEPSKKQTDDFQVEYAYVLKDLRRVFILAGVMFILLIALNLVLQ
ncbi:MAG: hypothetical protein H6658_09370 [Ardenticatenaceae bacterium]|nr:hypothetical protein [Ardenticatenaceae bacterium]